MTLTKIDLARRKKARSRVDKGAKLLDRKTPNWFKRISLKTLDLSKCTPCVCGQLAATSRVQNVKTDLAEGMDGYLAFSKYLGLEFSLGSDGTVAHGFSRNGDYGSNEPTWEELENAWARVIRRKLREAAAVAA